MAALAHGLPVVTTTGSLSEPFWKDSGSVVALPGGDLPGLARTILELSRQPERRSQVASAAKATYDSRFSLERLIHALRSDTAAVTV